MTPYIRMLSASIAFAIVLAGCQSSAPNESLASASATNTTFDNPPVLGAALSIETDYIEPKGYPQWQLRQGSSAQTAAIRVIEEFTFNSEQTLPADFSMIEDVSFQDETHCSEYRMRASTEYEFDYNSCVLSNSVFGGTATVESDLINQHKNVIGVVSFQDPSLQPIYQESHFD